MTNERCPHGRYADRCSPCRAAVGPRTPVRGANHGGQSRQECLATLCELLGMPALPVGVGSSVPSRLFRALAERFDVPAGSMPQVAEAVVRGA